MIKKSKACTISLGMQYIQHEYWANESLNIEYV